VTSHEDMSEDELWERSRSDDLSDRADSLMELGERRVKEEDWTLAKNLYGSALDLYNTQDRNSDAGTALYSLGYCHYALKEFEDAVESLGKSLALGREINDSRVIAFAAGPLGDSYRALSRNDEAIETYRLAIDTFVEIEENVSAAMNSMSLGEIFGQQAKQTNALECFIRAYNIYQTAGEAFGAALAKDRMAAALIELGDYDQAISHITDSLRTFEFLEKDERITHMNYRLGWTLVLAGQYFRAIRPLRLAVSMFKVGGDWSRAAMAEFHLANALHYSEPEDSVEEVTQILARIRSYFEQAGELGNVWMVDSVHAEKLMNSGMFIAAAEIFRDIIERAIKLDDDYTVRTARASLAEALFLAGETTEARQVLGLIDSAEWGENNVELQKLERVTALMLETLANTLDIDFPDAKTSRNRRA